jgi:hypothetical protein
MTNALVCFHNRANILSLFTIILVSHIKIYIYPHYLIWVLYTLDSKQVIAWYTQTSLVLRYIF